MNKIQRVAALGGVIVLLIAAGRVLTPFSTREVLNPDSARGAVYRTRECGIAASEAAKKPSVSHDEIVLTRQGAQEKAQAIRAAEARPGSLSASWLASLSVGPDSQFDHTTITVFTLSVCEKAGRRRVTSAGVLAVLALLGTVGAIVLLRDPRPQRDGALVS